MQITSTNLARRSQVPFACANPEKAQRTALAVLDAA